jgi:hypothetical protein
LRERDAQAHPRCLGIKVERLGRETMEKNEMWYMCHMYQWNSGSLCQFGAGRRRNVEGTVMTLTRAISSLPVFVAAVTS